MYKVKFVVILVCIAVTLSGCSMEENNKGEESGVMEQVGQQILEELLDSAADSYENSLNYRYPISKEFREQQIYKLIAVEVNEHLSKIRFME